MNLPDDREALAQIIERSRRSFAAVASGASEPAAKDRCFVFVAAERDSGAVVGTSMIFPQHGSRKAPHVYFDVLEEERYSETLDRHFAHRVLRIGYNYKGLTEIGGLVVRPEFRRHPERLGRLLMSVRFLYIARHRPAFRDEVLSELMPPLEADGTSLLWESLGRRFTGLTYQEADRLSQDNKEFIRALFPQDPLYASLLPAHVQELIGQVGPETKAVEKMLREIGFSYAHRIDPFDGGPHFQARTDDITLVRATRTARVAAAERRAPARRPVPPSSRASGPSAPYFIAVRTAIAVRGSRRRSRDRQRPSRCRSPPTRGMHCRSRPATRSRTFVSRSDALHRIHRRRREEHPPHRAHGAGGRGLRRRGGVERRGGAGAASPRSAPTSCCWTSSCPGMSGLETIERISKLKNLESAPTIIMISGHATLADAVRATKAGAYDLIEKPLDRERLMVALRNAARAARDGARGAGPARDDRRALRDGGPERADGGAVRPDRQGRADADARADHRRVGHRQGADRARHPPLERCWPTSRSSRSTARRSRPS